MLAGHSVSGLLVAVASDGVAVDHQGVQHQFRAGAAVFGALRTVQPVANQRSVAMCHSGMALAAAFAHCSFLALQTDRASLPRLSRRKGPYAGGERIVQTLQRCSKFYFLSPSGVGWFTAGPAADSAL